MRPSRISSPGRPTNSIKEAGIKITDKKTPFLGVSRVDNGYVVFSWDGEGGRHLNGRINGLGPESLRHALRMRNDLYAAHPFASKAMVIMQPNMDDARARTNTGHARISEIHHRGRWLFRVQHLDVGTGRRMARAFSYNTTARPVSREEALREALRFREDNAEAVAPIILEYNARVQEAFEELAELEVSDLTPRLHTLQGFSLERWMESREAAWASSGVWVLA